MTHIRNVGFIKTDKMVTKKGLTKDNEIKDAFVLRFGADLIIRYNNLLNTRDVENWTVEAGSCKPTSRSIGVGLQ